jgi:hypothetical protein
MIGLLLGLAILIELMFIYLVWELDMATLWVWPVLWPIGFSSGYIMGREERERTEILKGERLEQTARAEMSEGTPSSA